MKYWQSWITPRISACSWSGVQKMWASFSAKERTRIMPISSPDFSRDRLWRSSPLGAAGSGNCASPSSPAIVVADLGDAERQVPVAAQLVLVDQDVVRAVHRPELQLLAVVGPHRREHGLAVALPVPALPVEVELAHHRRHHVPVAAGQLLVDDPALQLAPDRGAVGEPEHVADPRPLVQREDAELPAEPFVVPLLRLRQRPQVLVQLLLREPGGPVDTAELTV